MFLYPKKHYAALTIFCVGVAASLILITGGCSKDATTVNPTDEVVIEVDPSLFIQAGLAEPITKVTKTLSDGTSTTCYKIVTNNTPTEHAVGPWCPTNITDNASKGGIWFEVGKVYDVDGAFIKNLASFYNDAVWKLYNTDGSIKVTNTKTACEAAARPNVDPAYNNYCVECQPSYVSGLKKTFYIPVKPVKLSKPVSVMGMMGSVIGIAFNGVNFDPPAPTSAILGAHTLAPMDDAGGHVNTSTGYHYHAATGMTKKVTQSDGHAAMIGYALDGYGMYERLDASGKEPSDLDDSRGHYDATRGYHYHVASAGSNSFINNFRGAQGSFSVSF
ncbi:YHYH protein [Spirosoma foliorum]|uniref:YHYH protein n=1 Tax=Spirosoma foliorum TaxID=2710596 RepID=A0A7G5H238_9BACT|nr:YHYH protein [Spirosoma foliorum]QMW05180.1 YHYH protein [Spirosoma foliorum]